MKAERYKPRRCLRDGSALFRIENQDVVGDTRENTDKNPPSRDNISFSCTVPSMFQGATRKTSSARQLSHDVAAVFFILLCIINGGSAFIVCDVYVLSSSSLDLRGRKRLKGKGQAQAVTRYRAEEGRGTRGGHSPFVEQESKHTAPFLERQDVSVSFPANLEHLG